MKFKRCSKKKYLNILKNKKSYKKTIFFSPCAASFDSFKNFEDRGSYFNKLIKKHFNGNIKFIIIIYIMNGGKILINFYFF